MPISEWPAGERPREKLLERGPAALGDAELVAVMMRTGVAGRDATTLARELLANHGGLRPLLELEADVLCRQPGVGPGKAAVLLAALELGRRYLAADLVRGRALTSPGCSARYLAARLRGYAHEVFACLFLDNRHRVIRYEELFRGTIDGASVHPREVVKRALTLNAAAVILAHNHPSGVCEPSGADRQITRRLQDALALVDVRVLDHFIVGDGAPLSFAEQGLL